MGNVYAEITLKNTRDVYKAEENLIPKNDIRDKLGLSVICTRIGYLAGDGEVFCRSRSRR